MLANGQGRADLINYVNDGTLPEVLTKGTAAEIKTKPKGIVTLFNRRGMLC